MPIKLLGNKTTAAWCGLAALGDSRILTLIAPGVTQSILETRVLADGQPLVRQTVTAPPALAGALDGGSLSALAPNPRESS
jgi:hypothetical protein